MNETQHKILLFVSTGRCATKRIAEILREKLPQDFVVKHQMPISPVANIIGNVMLRFGASERIKRLIYQPIVDRYAAQGHFICTDPLTAMVIPAGVIQSRDTAVVHLVRERESFAHSFFRLTRLRPQSWFAHNLIPFWQPGLYPFENSLNKNILQKYAGIADLKNEWFFKQYSINPHYRRITMDSLFHSAILEDIIQDFFNVRITINQSDWAVKANQTQ